MERTATSREIARRAVKGEIARAALRRFRQQGFEQTTVEEIARDVGISARTYFRYFASKDDVLLEPIASFKDAFLTNFSEQLTENTLWKSLELALRETVLACASQADQQSSFDIQALVRQTPALLARQLALKDALQLEAVGIYFARSLQEGRHDGSTVEATVRCAFACLEALENRLAKGSHDEGAGAALAQLMEDMMPCVLVRDQPPQASRG